MTKNESTGRFAWEKAIRDDPTLSREAKLLAFVLGTYMSSKTGKCHPSKKALVAGLCYRSDRALEKPRAELTRRGYLHADYRPSSNRTFYSGTLPSPTLTSVFEAGSAAAETRSG